MRTLLSLVLAFLGLVVGGVVGMESGYGLAELVGVTHRETQAYFQMFIAMPFGMVLGVVTGGLVAGVLTAPKEQRARKILPALLALLALAATCGVGLSWSAIARPAIVRVKNETTSPLENAYLGHDFRRSTSLGTIEPGATTGDVTVDLDQPGSFNGVHAGFRGNHPQLTLDEAQRASLTPSSQSMLVIREEGGALVIDARPD